MLKGKLKSIPSNPGRWLGWSYTLKLKSGSYTTGNLSIRSFTVISNTLKYGRHKTGEIRWKPVVYSRAWLTWKHIQRCHLYVFFEIAPTSIVLVRLIGIVIHQDFSSSVAFYSNSDLITVHFVFYVCICVIRWFLDFLVIVHIRISHRIGSY